MTFPDIFTAQGSQSLADRINKLLPDTKPQWGKMNVAQMLAHCNVPYEMVYEPSKFKKPNAFVKFMIKLFAKSMVVGDKPYPKNGRTAPDFLVPAEQDFDKQKQQILEHIWHVQKDGEAAFEGKESHAMGHLTANEWNTMFYKHLDHHLKQFGV